MALAERIERAEVQLIAAATEAARRRTRGAGGEFAIEVAGGVASFAGPDSPFTKVAGLGFDGVPSEADLHMLEGAYARVGAALQVKVSSLADPRILAALAERGYRLLSFENVLGRDLTALPDLPQPGGVEVSTSSEGEFDLWLHVIVEGVTHPDDHGVPAQEHFNRQELLVSCDPGSIIF